MLFSISYSVCTPTNSRAQVTQSHRFLQRLSVWIWAATALSAVFAISATALAQEGVTYRTERVLPRFFYTSVGGNAPARCDNLGECGSAASGQSAADPRCTVSVGAASTYGTATINGRARSYRAPVTKTCTFLDYAGNPWVEFYPEGWQATLEVSGPYDTTGPAWTQENQGTSIEQILGYTRLNRITQRTDSACKAPSGLAGNPISASTGEKIESMVDYSDASGLLSFERTYVSSSASGGGTISHNHVAQLIDSRAAQAAATCFNGTFSYVETVLVNGVPTDVRQYETYCFPYADTALSVSTPPVQVNLSNTTRLNFAAQLGGALTSVDGLASLTTSGSGAATLYTLRRPSSMTMDRFDAGGRLIARVRADGKTLSYAYSSTTPSELQSVTDSFGRSLSFSYNSARQLAGFTDPAGASTIYSYGQASARCRVGGSCPYLTTATFPGGSAKTYFYDETAYLSGVTATTGKLTGIADENGVRYANFGYDMGARAILSEHVGAVNRTTFAYQLGSGSSIDQATITDALGSARVLSFATQNLNTRATTQSQPAGSGCAASSSTVTYDAQGYVASVADFNGNRTCYANVSNAAGLILEGTRVEGVGAATACSTLTPANAVLPTAARKINTQWHPDWPLETVRAEPRRITTHVYNGQPDPFATPANSLASCAPAAALLPDGKPIAVLCKRVVQTTADMNGAQGFAAPPVANETRTWAYTYNALGQALTATDPLSKTTTTTYYAATDTTTPPKFTKGDLQTITNAVGHVVTMNEYDQNGRLLKMTDANGLITTMAYHPRGWLLSRSVNNGSTSETTFYVYDKRGALTRVVQPDGNNLFYAYDDAHRLVGISDQLINASPDANGALIVKQANLSGNKVLYTLDVMGNRVKEQHVDASNGLHKQAQRAIDALNRLKQDIGGTAYASAAPAGAPVLDASVTGAPVNAATKQYGYDANGNVTSTLDPLGRTTSNEYDALNRLTKVIDPYNGAAKPTIYQYDQSSNLVQVTDPQGLATSYTYNGHNNLITQSSPDTGATQFKYNALGNVVAKIDSGNSHVAANTGRCTTTAYDNLHRPTTIKYYAASNTATNTQTLCFGAIAGTVVVEETHTYTYDSITATLGGPGGKGRVSRIADAAGRVDYVYDLNGRITSKTQVTTGATNPNRVTTYQYSANGQLRSMSTPSGQTIAYQYGSATSTNPGKIVALMVNPTGYSATAEGGNVPTGGVSMLTSADYKPFGPNEGWDWGNSGLTLTSTPPLNQHLRQFDLDYRPSFIGNDPQGYSRQIDWDRANRITAITTPSGATLPGIANANSLNQAYAYDQLDRLTQFNAGQTGATTLATGMALLPSEQFTYDAIGNRLSRTTTAPGTTTNQTANYAYPNLSTTSGTKRHILNAISGAQVNAYTYDASGNTLTESAALATMNPYTGQLNATTTTQALAYTYDAKNRLKSAQIGANAADTVTYKINAMGQRVQKVGAGLYAYSTTATIDAATGNSAQSRSLNFNARYVYDESGRLIGEYAPDGKLISETVWFNDLPIATLRPKGANAGTPLGITGTTTGNPANGATAANANNVGNNTTTNRVNVEIFYVHPDHLGTPRTVTRSTVATGTNAPASTNSTSPGSINKAVWRWDSDPFGTSLGNSTPTENPQLITGTATQIAAATFVQSLGFMGQFRDRETGKSQNYFRDYDPAIGRYAQSDPVGLKAGVNTYGYVLQQPTMLIDPTGENPVVVVGACVVAVTAIWYTYKKNRLVKCLKECNICTNHPRKDDPGYKCIPPKLDEGDTGPTHTCRSYCALDDSAGPRGPGVPGSRDLP
jgi:RHS repeat-associated protein